MLPLATGNPQQAVKHKPVEHVWFALPAQQGTTGLSWHNMVLMAVCCLLLLLLLAYRLHR
jgi:hypothetical protein